MSYGPVAVWSEWMLSMSWQVALLALAVWGITRLCSRASASLRHLLWALVFLRLLLPPTLSVPWSVGTLLAESPVTVDITLEQESTRSPAAFPVSTSTASLRDGGATTPLQLSLGRHVAPLPLLPVLFWVWAGMAGLLFTVLVWQWRRFRRLMARTAVPADSASLAILEALQSQLGVTQQVQLHCSQAVRSPCLVGVLRPIIYLPCEPGAPLPAEALRHILAHELAHVKRRDLAVGWLAALLCCLYWFHPLVWLAHTQLRREREMSTDNIVLRLAEKDVDRYAATVLRVAEASRGGVPMAAGFVGAIEAGEDLLRRLRSASDPSTPRRMGWRSCALVGAVLLALPMAVWTEAAPIPTADVEAEIQQYYADASADVQEYIRWTAQTFSRGALWLPENALDDLSAEERERRTLHYAEALQGEYGRHLCQAIVESGVLKGPQLLPGLLKVATYHRDSGDYDCRPKWMAVQALGRLGREEAVPRLIPLVDHGNQNTRMWAQASLVRLTSQSLGGDKQAWGNWWNATGKTPRLTGEDLKPWTPPAGVAQAAPSETQSQPPQNQDPPEIVASVPAFGATEVDPALTELRVTFDQDMAGGFSWTGGGEVYPEVTDKPQWVDKRTCVIPVKLQPAKFYRIGINSKSHHGFKSESGVPARVRAYTFVTTGASEEELNKRVVPQATQMMPENGAQDVSSTLAELTITFNVPMGGGFSWTKAGGLYPETTGAPSWSEDQMTCTLPVKLQPNTEYTLGLNHAFAINFSSQWGVPLEPVVWTFKTVQ